MTPSIESINDARSHRLRDVEATPYFSKLQQRRPAHPGTPLFQFGTIRRVYILFQTNDFIFWGTYHPPLVAPIAA